MSWQVESRQIPFAYSYSAICGIISAGFGALALENHRLLMAHGYGLHGVPGDLKNGFYIAVLSTVLAFGLLLKSKPAFARFVFLTGVAGLSLLVAVLWVSVTETTWVLLNTPWIAALLAPSALWFSSRRKIRTSLDYGR